jgi:peroxiredoxin
MCATIESLAFGCRNRIIEFKWVTTSPEDIEEENMSLTEDLETQRQTSFKNATPGFTSLVEGMLHELRDHGLGRNAPNVGDAAPDFTLPSATGGSLRLQDQLARGPVVLAFYRGGWCPYCNLQLRAYQRELTRIRELNASLLAISPQTPDTSLDTAQKNTLAFDVVSDVGSHVARAYGLAFQMPDELQRIYESRNINLPKFNGGDDWTLPIPATFVVNRERRIVLSHVDVDYRTRLDPEDVIAALRLLHAKSGVLA